MFTEELKEQCSLPVGYKVVNMRSGSVYRLVDETENRFHAIDAGDWVCEVVLPDSDPELFGETFWLCETGKKSYLNVCEGDEEPMVVKPGCLAAFVSKGTHWECIVSDLPWS